MTGLHDEISVQELGIDNITAADGLAVGRASGFVGEAMEQLDGFYTLSDETMYLCCWDVKSVGKSQIRTFCSWRECLDLFNHQHQNYAVPSFYQTAI